MISERLLIQPFAEFLYLEITSLQRGNNTATNTKSGNSIVLIKLIYSDVNKDSAPLQRAEDTSVFAGQGSQESSVMSKVRIFQFQGYFSSQNKAHQKAFCKEIL